jgi:hypothetical protein
LEYFEFERIIVDEVHETLCTTRTEMNEAKEAAKQTDSAGFFKEKNRRAGRRPRRKPIFLVDIQRCCRTVESSVRFRLALLIIIY